MPDRNDWILRGKSDRLDEIPYHKPSLNRTDGLPLLGRNTDRFPLDLVLDRTNTVSQSISKGG